LHCHALITSLAITLASAASALAQPNALYIRVNQVGYLPDAPKVAVACALERTNVAEFSVVDLQGRRVFGPARAHDGGAFGPCVQAFRMDFSALRRAGHYIVVANGVSSPQIRIDDTVYRGAADTLLLYMRQQRSGYNPLLRDSVHKHDGMLVDHERAGEFIPVSGGWADAADYLQYVTTSAYATFIMMMAHRDYPRAVGDRFQANGLPGSNQLSDILDEARHGLEWLLRMYPEPELMLNQLGDDRDHAFWDLISTDSSDYGWGKGSYRPVYPCTGKPQGLIKAKNRADGYASTAGKYAAAFALGAQLFKDVDPAFAGRMATRAEQAYQLGVKYPGVCQTAPGVGAYFYEEDNWVDDMELGATQLYALTGAEKYRRAALEFARREPVTPWLGQDTANHYQWFPWHNNGHYELWRHGTPAMKRELERFYRDGLQRVVARAGNGFRIGIPFIWCSNNLMASFATQAHLYRRMTGDARFMEYEFAALDWLFGTNPWGVSMVIGYPNTGRVAQHPHSQTADLLGVWTQKGGLLDGPVYRSIYQNLAGISLHDADEYAASNTGFIVYHDDLGDYSTNEPIMDGTANLTYLVSALSR
jgi:hypothetical protein